jgi:hypothetical protein
MLWGMGRARLDLNHLGKTILFPLACDNQKWLLSRAGRPVIDRLLATSGTLYQLGMASDTL